MVIFVSDIFAHFTSSFFVDKFGGLLCAGRRLEGAGRRHVIEEEILKNSIRIKANEIRNQHAKCDMGLQLLEKGCGIYDLHKAEDRNDQSCRCLARTSLKLYIYIYEVSTSGEVSMNAGIIKVINAPLRHRRASMSFS
jgi:hypothetical protein